MARAVHLRRAETTTRLLRATQSTRPVLRESCPFPPLGADSRTYSEQRRRFFPPRSPSLLLFCPSNGDTPATRAHALHERPREASTPLELSTSSQQGPVRCCSSSERARRGSRCRASGNAR